ncbi:MAG: hypothetical protein LAT64_09170 [Phycisphaerales bacterium]|nr:hypothetical protein [Planctomycetota bacterium]MCH8508919.1 hypothetical protein [Phycisphaerales bacterium]
MMWRLYAYLIPSGLDLSRDAKRRVIRSAVSHWYGRVPVWISGILLLILAHGSVWIAGLFDVPPDREPVVLLGTVVFFFVAILSILPSTGLRRSVYCRLCEHGHEVCPRCGYPREGLDAVALCPECGADPIAESWDTATVSVLERVRFHHIPTRLYLPYETRRAVMRGAWRRLRHDNLSFSLYVASLILLPVSLFLTEFVGGWAVLGLLGSLMLYLWMEKRLLGACVRAELEERGCTTIANRGR